jgi:hypothetical protein
MKIETINRYSFFITKCITDKGNSNTTRPNYLIIHNQLSGYQRLTVFVKKPEKWNEVVAGDKS